MIRSCLAVLLLLCSQLAFATSRLALPSVGEGAIDRAIRRIQPFLDLMTGPYALLFTAIGMGLGMTLWFLSPKEGFVGASMRVVGLGIGLLNIPFFVDALRF
jgi:hypothetical protein